MKNKPKFSCQRCIVMAGRKSNLEWVAFLVQCVMEKRTKLFCRVSLFFDVKQKMSTFTKQRFFRTRWAKFATISDTDLILKKSLNTGIPSNLAPYRAFSSHNSPIYDACQTQSASVLALPWKRAHQDDSNDTSQPRREFQVDLPLLWIKDYLGLS